MMQSNNNNAQPSLAPPRFPRLFVDVKIALATLYSLPLDPSLLAHNHRPNSQQAHHALMDFQSRNLRRKIQSIHQQFQDQQQQQQQQHQQKMSRAQDASTEPSTEIELGSSCWAALALLLPVDQTQTAGAGVCHVASPTERLFAAQTLLHRLRRSKLTEAVDLEMERDHNLSKEQLLHASSEFYTGWLSSYIEWVQYVHPVAGAAVQQYIARDGNAQHQEERLKGELMLLTLAVAGLSIVLAGESRSHPALLSTTMAALTMAAIKLRYTITDAPTVSIVEMIHQAFQMVWNIVNESAGESHVSLKAAVTEALFEAVAALPETLLASPGGARGRLSMDPRMVQAAIADLVSIDRVHMEQLIADRVDWNDPHSSMCLIRTCERWAKYVPLPSSVLEQTLPWVCHALNASESPAQRVALAYLIAIYECATWSVDQILSTSFGLSQEQRSSQPLKKRQSSRSRKRQKEVLENQTTDASLQQAQAQVVERGELACQTTAAVWDALKACSQHALTATDTYGQVEGEGPIGCLAACANACLPHLLRNKGSAESFQMIAESFRHISSHSNKEVRALSLEPLYTVHTALLGIVASGTALNPTLESVIVDHFFECLMNMASACGYPSTYFHDFGALSDEELEIERNDVRDLLRSVAGSADGGSTADVKSSRAPAPIIVKILGKLLISCQVAVQAACEQKKDIPETAVHAFSSLAKPLNHIAKCHATSVGCVEGGRDILRLALHTLGQIAQHVVDRFKIPADPKEVLPSCRIANIATASLTPMLASLAAGNDVELLNLVAQVVAVCTILAIYSIEQIPELSVKSALDRSLYDIRGSMRGPGGEDHVGCLALMRLSSESSPLTLCMVEAITPYIPRLCELHGRLKDLERQRGQGIFHGSGVTPQSRRILLGVLCNIEIVAVGQAGASDALSNMFNSAVGLIASCKSRPTSTDEDIFQMTESTFDLAAYPSTVVASLFDAADGQFVEQRTACLETLTASCVAGYQRLSSADTFDARTLQWNRLRGALFLLLQKSGTPDLPMRATEVLLACISSECEAIRRQCLEGPSSSSSLFVDEIVSPDSVPAGAFVHVVGTILQTGDYSFENAQCLLTRCKETILSSIALMCPDPSHTGSFVDPRPTVAEAWYIATTRLLEIRGDGLTSDSILVDTFVSVISLLFYPSMGRTNEERRQDAGMSLDGPHTLAATQFLTSFFDLGAVALRTAALKLSSTLRVDKHSIERWGDTDGLHSIAIVGAALFRAVQGALPPWAVEAIPAVYGSFFKALGSNSHAFGLVLRVSMDIRLAAPFAGVPEGALLSGRFFEGISESTKDAFVHQAVELSRIDGAASWRRLKVVIKQMCGGKKKDTDFKQKPSSTRWEFERI